MKFCFFGYDHTLDIAQRLIADGHELMQIFTFPCDNEFVHNAQIHRFATQSKIPITEERVTTQAIKRLLKKKCTLFFSSGYPHKIPQIPEDKAYGLNLHPALLPKARGIMPLPYIIMHEPDAAGFTFHKMTQDFDAGDILFQHPINLDDKTDIETLNAKIAIHTPDAASKVIKNIEDFWKNAKTQDHTKATEYKQPSDEFRSFSWNETAQISNKKSRAFGRFGIIANISNDSGESQKLAVYNATAWTENNPYKTGTLLRSHPKEIVIAISDGYICLKEFQIIG